MTDLISRDALLEKLRQAYDDACKHEDNNPDDPEWVTIRDCAADAVRAVEEAPAIRPQVVINVTGGIADAVAGTHEVEINVLDYDIQAGEQDDYIVDEDGDQAWLYGEVTKADPAAVHKIINYPTVADQRASCVRCGNTDNDGSDTCPDCGDEMQ